VSKSQRQSQQILGDGGVVLGTAEYVDGILDKTSRIYNGAGQLTQEVQFSGGRHHGQYRTWWDNGQLKEIGAFSQGSRVGLCRWYGEDGELTQQHDYGSALLTCVRADTP
jgi:antitoxin component YwqK of YwqJK toxin-antitoxin module